ncbi:MAG: extracellular solute-binding protein [Pseudomonadota bacterium]
MTYLRYLLISCLLIFAHAASAENSYSHAQIEDSLPHIYDTHALSLFGDVKYSKDFKHYDYVNPNAPKGGEITLSATGGFDTLNALNGMGEAAPALNLTYDSLMASSLDEPASEYPLIAERVRYPDNYAWVEFDINPKARWSDGRPITIEDVIFSLNILKEKGSPIFRYYYANIIKAEKKAERTVRFIFDKPGNRELPLITGQLVILPKHFWEDKDFASASLIRPVTSGPYKIGDVIANRTITYIRDPDYWGKDLPANKGIYNFDNITYEMYRDTTIQFEAFKSGEYDFRYEFSAKNWTKGYDFPAYKQGLVKKKTLTNLHPKPLQGLIFNKRKDIFKDPTLRQALSMTLDFPWLNKNIFFNSYKRTQSFFEQSELAAKKLPTDDELTVLETYRGQLPPELFTKPFANNTITDPRRRLRGAFKLLKENGYTHKNGVLHTPSGEAVRFKILNSDPTFERVLIPITENMKKLGADVAVRTVDPAQYTRRIRKFDFDMVMSVYAQSSSPGNEQREYWGSAAAERQGSRNYAGIKDPVIDDLIERLIFAKNREELVTLTNALDRILQWKRFLIPLWYSPFDRIAYRDKFGMPKADKFYGSANPSILWWARSSDKSYAKDIQE